MRTHKIDRTPRRQQASIESFEYGGGPLMCVQCIEPFEHGGSPLVCIVPFEHEGTKCEYSILSHFGMEVVP